MSRNSSPLVLRHCSQSLLKPGQAMFGISAGKRELSPPRNIQTGPEARLASCSIGTGVLSREYSDRSVRLTTHLHLELELVELYL